MGKDYDEMVRYTKNHFMRLARENRFPENGKIPHNQSLCLVCRPEEIKGDFELFLLDLVVECILERRPKFDEELVKAIKEELEMEGSDLDISLDGLLKKETCAFEAWRIWARNAINTAFDMLSVHGGSVPYLQLEDNFSESEIDLRLEYLFNKQRSNAVGKFLK